jgi:effector-binding domain-containing protein
MMETPRIVQTDAQLTAVIQFTIPREEIQAVMDPAIAEIMQVVTAKGVGPTGPVFSHHFRIVPGIFDFEVGVPVLAPFAPDGRVKPSALPAATVARTTYYGPYDGLGTAWRWLSDWIHTERYTPAEDLWECYIAGPETSRKSADWRTELNRPLTNRA